MKHHLIIFLLLTSFEGISQDWQWSSKFGGLGGIIPAGDAVASVCADNLGNLYTVGGILGPSANFETDTIFVNGFNDMYLVKYDPNGNFLWAKVFGGPYNNSMIPKSESSVDVLYDTYTNSIFVVGKFIGSCIIDTFILSGSNDEIFIARFDLSGNCIWARSAGSLADDAVSSIISDNAGRLYISGTVGYSGVFGSMNIQKGGFLAKYDTDGNCLWVKNIFNGTNHFTGSAASPRTVEFFQGDLILLANRHADTLYVDTVLVTGSNFYADILSRFDSTGKVKWVVQSNAPSTFSGGLAMDSIGNCYYGSTFSGGNAIFGNDTLYPSGHLDFYIVKYDANGHYIWSKQGSTSDYIRFSKCSSNSSGEVYFTGYFEGSLNFQNVNIASSGNSDIFIFRLDTLGNCLGFINESKGIGSDVLTLNDGSCIVVGILEGSITLGNQTYQSLGYDDVFIAKLSEMTSIFRLINMNEALVIYANPTTGISNIVLPQNLLNIQRFQILIYNQQGSLISQFTMGDTRGDFRINLSQQAKGMYYVVLTDGSTKYRGKIILE